ncbi:MAG: hypothetical protein A2X61_07695 [Ignavibacteria bacterium GWB2_35_12]|nr:MAG: hypothetical protein A2X61_07695 [Ignavibacteria bacterium GWB2_35_12]OGU90183.1 MAG: hypothetical protein A2220_16360 [Ignavibacteria bacterium RIFOXYA2_FULL_35_10]OGV21918.1 MAG: hypothetical protein A2475_09865 [Ignavibacteria bacterium RIFOXYC2_FULL_35_21]
MYGTGKVLIGILIFILAFTSPILINMAGGKASVKANPVLPQSGKCIESKEYMKGYHMEMLDIWRDKVVRQDIRFLKKADGSYYMLNGAKAEMSLTKTCMSCHDNKAKFCDECHNYLDVNPYCWDCHIDPSLAKKGVTK